jgi:hypothetical protein
MNPATTTTPPSSTITGGTKQNIFTPSATQYAQQQQQQPQTQPNSSESRKQNVSQTKEREQNSGSNQNDGKSTSSEFDTFIKRIEGLERQLRFAEYEKYKPSLTNYLRMPADAIPEFLDGLNERARKILIDAAAATVAETPAINTTATTAHQNLAANQNNPQQLETGTLQNKPGTQQQPQRQAPVPAATQRQQQMFQQQQPSLTNAPMAQPGMNSQRQPDNIRQTNMEMLSRAYDRKRPYDMGAPPTTTTTTTSNEQNSEDRGSTQGMKFSKRAGDDLVGKNKSQQGAGNSSQILDSPYELSTTTKEQKEYMDKLEKYADKFPTSMLADPRARRALAILGGV